MVLNKNKVTMQEQWIRWEPIVGLKGKYDIDTILDSEDGKGLIITLYEYGNKSGKVQIVFDAYADSYRHTNESFNIRGPSQLTKVYGKDFYGDWTFFKKVNSEYLAWLAHESCDYSKEFDFTHFCLLCTNSVLDIIARYEPMVRHLPNNEASAL